MALEWNGNKLWGVTEERRIGFRGADGISDAPVPDTLPRHRAETRWAAVGIADGKEIAVAESSPQGGHEHMSEENITRMSLTEANLLKGQTDWEWLAKQDAAGVEPEPDPEEGEVDWSQARVVMPPSKPRRRRW